MFGDDKLKRSVDAQAKVNMLLNEQHTSMHKTVEEMHERLVSLEKEHIGMRYALSALASAVRFSSNGGRDALSAVIDAAVAGLPEHLQQDTEFCAGITALRDEKTFSRVGE